MLNPKRIVSFFSLSAVCGLMTSLSLAAEGAVTPETPAALYPGFANPTDEYRPRTWWHWMDDGVTQYGITKDLEAMKEIGLKGAQIFYIGGNEAEEGEMSLLSPAWLDAVQHAAKECERLGLKLGSMSAAGVSGSGGPWITPELSMQDLVWRDTRVQGPVNETITLPQPRTNMGYYRDIAVLAFPTLAGDAEPIASLRPKIHSNLPGTDWSPAIDGDSETFVSLPPNAPEGHGAIEVVFEFEAAVQLRSLVVQLFEQCSNRTVKISISEDGKAWRHIASASCRRGHVPAGREELVEGFGPRETRYAKVEFSGSHSREATKLYELNFQPVRLRSIHAKAGRQSARPDLSNPSRQTIPKAEQIALNTIVDLTDQLQPDGTVECNLPAGDWTIMRIGHTAKGNMVGPASGAAAGLEVDKLSVAANEHNFHEGVLGHLVERLGPLTGDAFNCVTLDSWEAGCQTWTKDFAKDFAERRGYDCQKWLIAVTGRIVGDVDLTERFLWDYRRTVADLLVDGYFGTLRRLCNEQGILLEGEAPGTGIPTIADGIQSLGMMDIPQGEFWIGGDPHPDFPNWVGGNDNTKEPASAAHVYGKEIVSCEAFTSFGHHDGWTQYPSKLKPIGDRQFCKGLNEMVFHRFAHQPDDRFPGQSLGQFGLNFDRTLTWWKPGRAWIEYLTRSQYMLRQGRFFADVCYYYGEDSPNSAYYYVPKQLDPRQMMRPILPEGYDYDVCDWTTFATMTVEDGYVVLPSGMRYAYLVLPNGARYTPKALEKVAELVQAGATVIGDKPSRSPSLNDYLRADQAIQKLAAELWPQTDGAGERRVGKGRVITGKTFETIFEEDALSPDFRANSTFADSEVRYIHRKLATGEMYYVSNQKERVEELILNFRVTGFVPEAWDPVTGEKSELLMYHDDGSSTAVALRMAPYDAQFIVFRKAVEARDAVMELLKDGKHMRSLTQPAELVPELSPTLRAGATGNAKLRVWESGEYALTFQDGVTKKVAVNDLPKPETLQGSWSVSFPKDRGAPEGTVMFDQLESWTQRPEEGIQYFSGTASYRKSITLNAVRLKKNRHVVLDLGAVSHLAEVFVNDQPLGVLWNAPFRVDITDAAKAGVNTIEVRVTNVWKNRLIGDAKLPEAERTTWTAYPFYKNEPDAPLMESGLLGPVRLLSAESVSISCN